MSTIRLLLDDTHSHFVIDVGPYTPYVIRLGRLQLFEGVAVASFVEWMLCMGAALNRLQTEADQTHKQK